MHHNLLKKFDLDSLKSKVDNLDIDKIFWVIYVT